MMISIFLFICVVASIFYLIIPFGKRIIWSYGVGEDALRLQERKEAALIAIHDVDFEYAAGKMSEEDYKELRNQYKGEAVNILREMDLDTSLGSVKTLTPDLQKDLKKEIVRLKRLKEVGV